MKHVVTLELNSENLVFQLQPQTSKNQSTRYTLTTTQFRLDTIIPVRKRNHRVGLFLVGLWWSLDKNVLRRSVVCSVGYIRRTTPPAPDFTIFGVVFPRTSSQKVNTVRPLRVKNTSPLTCASSAINLVQRGK